MLVTDSSFVSKLCSVTWIDNFCQALSEQEEIAWTERLQESMKELNDFQKAKLMVNTQKTQIEFEELVADKSESKIRESEIFLDLP